MKKYISLLAVLFFIFISITACAPGELAESYTTTEPIYNSTENSEADFSVPIYEQNDVEQYPGAQTPDYDGVADAVEGEYASGSVDIEYTADVEDSATSYAPTEELANTEDTAENASYTPEENETPTSQPSDESESEPEQPQELSTESKSSDTALLPTPPADEPIILTISGDGVNSETTWTLSQLQALHDGYRETIFSTTNNWPSFDHTEARGISLPYLLRRSGMLDNAASFRLLATDGYYVIVTYNQVFGPLYAFTNHSHTGSSGALVVEPVIAWVSGDVGNPRASNLRSFFGQSGPREVNNAFFVRNLNQIHVLTTSSGAWAAPEASIADGSSVPPGTEFSFLHETMDRVRIYFTIDGSEPNFNSPVFNPSTSFFQPHLTVPLMLDEDIVIRAFAAGLGRDRSPVVTFNFTVE